MHLQATFQTTENQNSHLKYMTTLHKYLHAYLI